MTLQDLNGLLPQMFPDHFLWKRLLLRKSITESDITRYLGLWGDLQDPDINSWIAGEMEPQELPSGMNYPNGFAQNNKVLERVFSDRPKLKSDLLSFSDIDAPFEANFLNSPVSLLQGLFDAPVAAGISTLRNQYGNADAGMLRPLLPATLPMDSLTFSRSNLLRVEVLVKQEDASWRERRTVRLVSSSKPPFEIILNN